ncbi:GNAT family N-acetyltransferase [Vreelandella rituensis]|uniref:tRNA(Met) cytidine acetyltransferase TmcA n=1 Tax=Vreelandella rituensis TaxID=2282306 RepID=A0A368UBL2_9GAMM|nr:GNAT family N-acetyltransferase [Halomonas rituensis]RCV92743.1 tRNA(Met) cytidine acetyltransferase [Halomonas rituensis]
MPHFSSSETPMRAAGLVVRHACRLKRRGWRNLVWLRGDAVDCHRLALALWQAHSWQAPLWVGNPAPVTDAISPRQARTRLGAEHGLVIIDAVSQGNGFDPDALGALSGTLQAGGLLVLMTPIAWGETPDADYVRFADYPHAWPSLSANYLKRLAQLLHRSSQVVHWQAGQCPHLPRLPARPKPTVVSEHDQAMAPECVTLDQAAVVQQLTHLRRRRPIVITADRGRGKSAALGIASAQLLQSGVALVVLSAPRPSAVEAVFARLEVLCPQGLRDGLRFVLPDVGEVRFVAPDVLTRQVAESSLGGKGSYLLVDEAAAIPAALLGTWLEAFPRIAFATTIHGYEGSGRGFALRFRAQLDQRTPDWRQIEMQTPVRWTSGDPLEEVTSSLLLLDAQPGPVSSQPVEVVSLERAELAHDEPRLRAVFGLLVQAHYRTTPSDLRQLLDGPGTRLQVVKAKGFLPQAVLVTRDEGGFDSEMADRVARGERRPQGHLLAQSLAAHAGSREAVTRRWRRVTRIATHPERRREGLGRALIDADIPLARAQGREIYGATFGADPDLLAFWRALGFIPLRLGLKRDTTTGEHALMVAQGLTAQGSALVEQLRQRFHAALPGLLAFELTNLPAAVATALLADLPKPAVSEAMRQDLEDVAFAQREPALARPAIQALVLHGCQGRLAVEDQQSCRRLVAWAFQGRALDKARGAATLELRKAVAALLHAGVL